jgi:L-amino acid N-acyltransferase YncA
MAATDPVVRSASLVDLAQVERIYRHYVDESVVTFDEAPPDRDEWVRRLQLSTAQGLPFLVAESCGRVLGYAVAARWRTRPAYRHTIEESVYVAPSAVGRGVGHALLDELLRRCARANVREVVAVIVDTGGTGNAGDTASVAVHRRCGFVEVGRLARVGHKHGRWLDTILMQRSLTAVSDPVAS